MSRHRIVHQGNERVPFCDKCGVRWPCRQRVLEVMGRQSDLTARHGPPAAAAPCWLSHAPVESDEAHMLLGCDEADRLKEAARLREIVGLPLRPPDQPSRTVHRYLPADRPRTEVRGAERQTVSIADLDV